MIDSDVIAMSDGGAVVLPNTDIIVVEDKDKGEMTVKDLSVYIVILTILIIGLCALLGYLVYDMYYFRGARDTLSTDAKPASDSGVISRTNLLGAWSFEDGEWLIRMEFADDDGVTVYISRIPEDEEAAIEPGGVVYTGQFALLNGEIRMDQLTVVDGAMEDANPFIKDGDSKYPYKYNTATKILQISFTDEGNYSAFSKWF